MIAAALSASVSLRTGRTSTPTASPTGAAVATIAVVDAKGTRPRPKSRCSTPDGVVLGPSATCSSSGPRSAAWHAPHPVPRPARRSAALPGQPSQTPGRRPATSTTRHRPAAPDATPTSSAHERKGPPPPQRSHPKRPSEPILAEPPTAVTARTHEPRRRRARACGNVPRLGDQPIASVHASSTAKSRCRPSSPFSCTSLSSRNSMSGPPATRSRTTLDTSISPARAWLATRAA